MAINTITVTHDGSANGTSVFSTIQSAVDYAASHSEISTIEVAAGQYHEEVTVDGGSVTQALTIHGDPGAVLIAPDNLTLNIAGGVALLAATNNANLTVDGLSVDGRDELGQLSALGGTVGYGIYFADSNGTIENGSVTGIKSAISSGVLGQAIFAGNVAGTGANSVNITNETVSDFQKTGIRVGGENFIANVTGNTVTGSGAIDYIAQNGITFLDGAGGTVTGNTISQLGYFNANNPDGFGAGGVLINNNDGDHVTEISGNTITMATDGNGGLGFNYGIGLDGPSTTAVTNNSISNANTGIGQWGDFGSFSAPIDISTNTLSGNNTNLDFEDFNDPLTTGSPNFNVTGTTGADYIVGGDGNDTISGGGGSSGTGVAYDYLDGALGTNTVTFADAGAGVSADLSLQDGTIQNTGGAGEVELQHFQNLQGSSFADTLAGDGSANTIGGGQGDDSIRGGGGNDRLQGGAGADILRGNTGDDLIFGGAGNDTLYGGDGNDILDGGSSVLAGDPPDDSGDDILNGAGGLGVGYQDFAGYLSSGGGVTVDLSISGPQDTVSAGHDTLLNIDNLIGSTFNDSLTGNANNNILSGDVGNDSLKGGLGDDTLFGGAGNDDIHGGAGSDAIIGGSGNDQLWGGTAAANNGSDTFYFGASFGNDVVNDFDVTHDALAFTTAMGTINSVAAGSGTLFYDQGGDSVLLAGVSIAQAGSVNIDYNATLPQEPAHYGVV